MKESRGIAPVLRPGTFARHARAALEKHVPEARTSAAHWSTGTNEAWVRFERADGLHGYVALRRHLDWINGEAGISREPRGFDELVRLPARPAGDEVGFRVGLGELLHGEDRWWPAGDSEGELVACLEHLALQLAVKGGSFFRHWPEAER